MATIRTTIAACLVALTSLIAGCGSDEGDGDQGASATTEATSASSPQQETVPASVTVSVGDNFYKPDNLTIRVGQAIKWKNEGAVPHTVTSDSDSKVKFDSGDLDPRGVYALKPTTQGKLTYYCTIHGKSQSGTVSVTR